jgi:hypothetical protein
MFEINLSAPQVKLKHINVLFPDSTTLLVLEKCIYLKYLTRSLWHWRIQCQRVNQPSPWHQWNSSWRSLQQELLWASFYLSQSTNRVAMGDGLQWLCKGLLSFHKFNNCQYGKCEVSVKWKVKLWSSGLLKRLVLRDGYNVSETSTLRKKVEGFCEVSMTPYRSLI